VAVIDAARDWLPQLRVNHSPPGRLLRTGHKINHNGSSSDCWARSLLGLASFPSSRIKRAAAGSSHPRSGGRRKELESRLFAQGKRLVAAGALDVHTVLADEVTCSGPRLRNVGEVPRPNWDVHAA